MDQNTPSMATAGAVWERAIRIQRLQTPTEPGIFIQDDEDEDPGVMVVGA